MFPLRIFGSVGPDQENALEDVSRVATALAEVGEPDAQGAALSGRWDDSLDKSVKSFQDNHGLDIDGVLLPGGPTENEINLRLKTRSEPGNQGVAERMDRLADPNEYSVGTNSSLESRAAESRDFGRAEAKSLSSAQIA